MKRLSLIVAAALLACGQEPAAVEAQADAAAPDCYKSATEAQKRRMMECVNELLDSRGDYRRKTCQWLVMGIELGEATCLDMRLKNQAQRMRDCSIVIHRPDEGFKLKVCQRFVLGEGEPRGEPQWYIEHGSWDAAQIAQEILDGREGKDNG